MDIRNEGMNAGKMGRPVSTVGSVSACRKLPFDHEGLMEVCPGATVTVRASIHEQSHCSTGLLIVKYCLQHVRFETIPNNPPVPKLFHCFLLFPTPSPGGSSHPHLIQRPNAHPPPHHNLPSPPPPMCNPTTAILFIAKALHARHEARKRLRKRARQQETDSLTDPAVRTQLPLDADGPINTIGALTLSAAKFPDPPSVGQERGWASASAGREMVVHQAHALPALSVPLHRDDGLRDPWPYLYAFDTLDRLAGSGWEMVLREDGVEDVGRMMRGMRIADERLRISDRGREGGSRGWGEEEFERRMGGLRISDGGRGRGAESWEEEDLGRRMGALRISDNGRHGRVWGGGEEGLATRMRGVRISDGGRNQVLEVEEDYFATRMRGLRISDVRRE